MSLTLSLSDKADGTGATATVAGSNGGTVSVYVQAVDGAGLSSAWGLAGTRVGDGTLALALNPGSYFAYCSDPTPAVSGVAYVRATSSTAAVADRCFAAVKAWAALLNLPCTARVYDYAFCEDPTVQYPCLVLTSEDGRQTDDKALNGRDDWGHPVRLLIRDVVPAFDESVRATFRLWRQSLTRAFHNQRLAGVPESVRNKVEPGVLLRRVAGEKFKNIAESELVLRCITREVRGLGA